MNGEALYRDWDVEFRYRRNQRGEALHRLCGPFLVDPTEEFLHSTRRTILVGQETNGWIPVSHFLNPAEGLAEALLWYREFNLAEGHAAASSPFWSFHRSVAKRLGIGWREVLWTNLVRFDGTELGAASLLNHSLASEIFEVQRGLLVREISQLGVRNAIFVTGPAYDKLLLAELDGAELRAIPGFDMRELAMIHTPHFPSVRMFRTYHPKYLRMTRRTQPILDAVCAGCV